MRIVPSSNVLPHLLQSFEDELRELQDRDLFRRLATIEEVRGAEVRLDGRWLACWCGNDYLGLSLHPAVIRAAALAAARWGTGARASRLLSGSTTLHAGLEDALAEFFGAEGAVVFASGYLANLGTLSALVGPRDLVAVDRLAHASLIDACRASRATLRVFPHNDAAALSRLLTRRAGRRLVVTEGVFSMDGDRAPLAALLDAVQQHEASLYVDDAHGACVLGETGRGSPEEAGVPHEALLYMGTLGKALGAQGGFVAGPKPLIELLQNRARTFIYATALAVPVAAAALEALRIVREDPSPRAMLRRNIEHLHARLTILPKAELMPSEARQMGFPASHIIPVVVGSARRARELSAELLERGILAPAIRPPTVPEGTARIRLSVSALHTDEHVDALATALRDLL